VALFFPPFRVLSTGPISFRTSVLSSLFTFFWLMMLLFYPLFAPTPHNFTASSPPIQNVFLSETLYNFLSLPFPTRKLRLRCVPFMVLFAYLPRFFFPSSCPPYQRETLRPPPPDGNFPVLFLPNDPPPLLWETPQSIFRTTSPLALSLFVSLSSLAKAGR